MQKGLVSVIIPTYNSVHTLERSLDSVLKQNYKQIEIIIVDDASNDSTEDFVELYITTNNSINFVFHKNSRNIGVGKTRNIGMEKSRGEYFAFLDSDDEWILDNKLTMQIDFLKQNPDYGFVSTAWDVMNPWVDKHNLCFLDDASFRKIALKHYPAHTSSWVFRSYIFSEIGWFWSHRSEDYEYLLRIWTITKCFSIPIITEKYHNSPKGHYQTHIFSSFFFWLFICAKYSLKYNFFLSSFFDRVRRWFIGILRIMFWAHGR